MKTKSPISPPSLADRFFAWYCREELRETILGDLHERYLDNYKKDGPIKANMKHWLNVFRFINQYTLGRSRRPPHYHSNHIDMIKNYLKVTLRSLWKNRVFAGINVFGLAVGLASCLIIFLHVRKELGFDQFHTKSDNIYRVTNTFKRSSGPIHWARTPPALAPAIRANLAAVEKATRLRHTDDHLYTIGDRSFYQGNAFFADSLFLEMFDFELKAGDRNSALDDPGNIVITEAIATKFFGDGDPMGKLITFDNQRSLKVTGVLEPVPTDSHITFDMLISFSTFEVPSGYLANLNSWGWAGFFTYVELAPGVDTETFADQTNNLYQENFKDRPDLKVAVDVQPLREIYLGSSQYSNVGESIRVGNRTTIMGLSVIAVLILVIAGFNFMNLSTAMSLGRGKEIGVRKVMGAAKTRIVTQFLTESVVVGLISLMLALVFVVLSEPYFKQVLGIELPNSIISYLQLLPLLLLSTVAIGILAGSYPSVVLSAFNPILVLRGNLKTSTTGAWLRKGLMVFQFAISLGLIAASLIIFTQMEFIQNKSLGYDRDNILKLKLGTEEMITHYDALKNRFLQNSRVLEVAKSSHSFDGSSASGPAWVKGADREDAHQLAFYQTDHDFLKMAGIKLLEGRYFSKEFPNDTATALVLNQSAVEAMELTNPINEKINFNNRERTVIGVVEDFHYSSLHTPIAPMGLVMPFVNVEFLFVKISDGDIREALASLEKDWKSIVGDLPMQLTFLDDGIQSLYEKEAKLSSLIMLFSGLAVLLACLGLYGLVAFSINNKLKEVGIRKALGASMSRLLALLSKEFIYLILAANLIAWPVTWYFADEWLSSFAYRIPINWGTFLIAALLLLAIAMITISHQTIKAALTNPVKVLRNE